MTISFPSSVNNLSSTTPQAQSTSNGMGVTGRNSPGSR
jgi:hypothetical protein